MAERISKADEVKPVENTKELIEVKESPVLVPFNEFVSSLAKECRVETIGSFIYWMERKGTPRKLSLEIWKKYFDEFINRKT